VRSIFSAHGINVVVGAENHAGMLAGLGGGFLSLDIWVDDEDSEEATALLRDLRERDDGTPAHEDDDDDEYDGDETGESWRAAPVATVNQRIDQRRRTAVALILGCCITFGTAHMFTGAWMRGVALAAVELVGIFQAGAGHTLGGVAAVAAILVDLIGALWRIRARRTTLPVARLRSS
jgi:Putative prokaryotic signal transducing protein